MSLDQIERHLQAHAQATAGQTEDMDEAIHQPSHALISPDAAWATPAAGAGRRTFDEVEGMAAQEKVAEGKADLEYAEGGGEEEDVGGGYGVIIGGHILGQEMLTEEEEEETDWYYFDGTAQHGPVHSAHLAERRAEGELSESSALFWREGMDSWLPLKQVPALLKEMDAFDRAVEAEMEAEEAELLAMEAELARGI